MKLDAIGVTSKNMAKTIAFYSLLGFSFPKPKPDALHIEAKLGTSGVRFMIDSAKLITDLTGKKPVPANHAAFAILCKNPAAVDKAVEKIKAAKFKVVKKPWDAPWGQRYAVVQDPDGYQVDLFAAA